MNTDIIALHLTITGPLQTVASVRHVSRALHAILNVALGQLTSNVLMPKKTRSTAAKMSSHGRLFVGSSSSI